MFYCMFYFTCDRSFIDQFQVRIRNFKAVTHNIGSKYRNVDSLLPLCILTGNTQRPPNPAFLSTCISAKGTSRYLCPSRLSKPICKHHFALTLSHATLCVKAKYNIGLHRGSTMSGLRPSSRIMRSLVGWLRKLAAGQPANVSLNRLACTARSKARLTGRLKLVKLIVKLQ